MIVYVYSLRAVHMPQLLPTEAVACRVQAYSPHSYLQQRVPVATLSKQEKRDLSEKPINLVYYDSFTRMLII